MLKLTNSDIFGIRGPLQVLIGQKFPVATSYQLAKMASKVNEQLRIIEDIRQKLIQKYGEPGPNGRGMVVKEDNPKFPHFMEEFNELLAIETELPISKVRLPSKTSSTCSSCGHNVDVALEIEPSILMALDKFVDVAC